MAKSSFFSGTGVSTTNTNAIENSVESAAASATAASTSATSAAASATSASANIAANQASAAASEASKVTAVAAKVTAVAAQAAALTSANNASTSATASEASKVTAVAAQTSATASSTSAATSATTATTKAAAASISQAAAATSAANAQSYASSSLPLSGGNLTGNLGLPVNGKIILGSSTSNSLQVYNDGSNSIITESSAGSLLLRGNSLYLQDVSNNNYVQALSGGAVTLYDNTGGSPSPKIATSSSGASISGNIAVTGTVDGRDVATDGTKLDTIETSATADQTNAEIKTAYESNSDTNAFTDADHTKLDGIAASANNYVLPSGYATETYVTTQVTNLVDSSPATLNTLNELAAALGDDPNFATTTANSIGTKAALSGAVFTGAITTNSTIDGRDVAADGVTADAALPKAGGTLTGNLSLGDNVKAQFGASNDLQIYHDGSNSYITDTTGGNFFINDDGAGYLMMKGSDLYFRNPSNADMIHAQSGGFVKLYHNGAEKLATTSTGIDVTGVVAADSLTVDNFTLDGTTLALSSGELTIDSAEDITFDADGGDFIFKDGGTVVGTFSTGANDFEIRSRYTDKDLVFKGVDGGSTITALTLDMSAAGFATFNNGIKANRDIASYGANTGSSANRMAMSMEGSGVSRLICNGPDGSTNGTFEVFTAYSGGTGSVKLGIAANGAVIVGSAVASTNVEFNLNGVASKAQRIQFQEGGVNRWLLGQGAASETSAFELYNATGTIALSVDRSTNAATFASTIAATSATFTPSSGETVVINRDSAGPYFGNSSNHGLRIITNNASRINISNSGNISTHPPAGNHFVINEDGVDSDFRVESDAQSHALFLNGATGKVNLNTSAAYSGQLNMVQTAADAYGIVIQASGNDRWLRMGHNGTNAQIDATYNASGGHSGIQLLTGGASRIDVEAGGNVVINEAGVDADFRVESNNDSSALFVDGADGTTTVRKLNLGVGGGLMGEGAISVGTSATNITSANDMGTLVIVAGNSSGAIFSDLVFFATTMGATVVTGGTVSGGPASRTYSVVSSKLKLAMASGTYSVKATAFHGTL